MRRRTFLVAAAGPALPLRGEADRVRVAVVGLGGRGLDHIHFLAALPDAAIPVVCDVNQPARERAVALAEKLTGRRPDEAADIRRILDRRDVDAVALSTPNHWHALQTIWACQAGKDVYCEKPASHNLEEGRRMAAAAQRYGRMVQVGAQSRSIGHKREAVERLRSGEIGEIYRAQGFCYKRRKSIGRKPDRPSPPAGLDWDQFLGPAPMRPFNENRFAYNWHWFWDTGNGDIGNQGVHELDLARWGLGEEGPPVRVFSEGGKYLYDDDQETPNTQNAIFTFASGRVLEFSVRGLLTPEVGRLERRDGNTIGVLFYGRDGVMAVDAWGYRIYRGETLSPEAAVPFREGKVWDTTPHWRNFLEAVRSRKSESLACGIENGVMAAGNCHMANISYRLKRQVHFDAAAFAFSGDAEANAMRSRDYRAPYRLTEPG